MKVIRLDMWRGKCGAYHWAVSSNGFANIMEQLLASHAKQLIHIASFDSGPIVPNEEEVTIGWTVKDEIMISPPISEDLIVPYDQYDEWYISKNTLEFPKPLEIFVNYGGFQLASPDELTKNDDPTWERGRCDYLYPLQERFWCQLNRINPETYVALGDHDVLISKNEELVKKINENV